ncbi:hypothetical protein EMIT0P258_350004 [Pseudomonas sp. IT-P258]
MAGSSRTSGCANSVMHRRSGWIGVKGALRSEPGPVAGFLFSLLNGKVSSQFLHGEQSLFKPLRPSIEMLVTYGPAKPGIQRPGACAVTLG